MRYAVKDENGTVMNMTVVGNNQPILPEGFTMIGEVPSEIDGADCKFLKETDGEISVDSDAKVASARGIILQALRDARAPLIADADIEINKLIDASGDYSALSTYRQALRDVTDFYKTNDVPNAECDSLVVAEFVWPVKP